MSFDEFRTSFLPPRILTAATPPPPFLTLTSPPRNGFFLFVISLARTLDFQALFRRDSFVLPGWTTFWDSVVWTLALVCLISRGALTHVQSRATLRPFPGEGSSECSASSTMPFAPVPCSRVQKLGGWGALLRYLRCDLSLELFFSGSLETAVFFDLFPLLAPSFSMLAAGFGVTLLPPESTLFPFFF